MFYDAVPTTPASSSSGETRSTAATSGKSKEVERKKQKYPQSAHSTESSDYSSRADSPKIDLSSGTHTIVPFLLSQRTASSFKNMIAARTHRRRAKSDHSSGDESITVQIVYQSYADDTKKRKKETQLSKRLSFKERILTLIGDIFASMIVTIISLLATGVLLLLCWKDALSIEITRDGILIVSNVRYIDDIHVIQEDDQNSTLSMEHVLGFPEVRYGHVARISSISSSSSSFFWSAVSICPSTLPPSTQQKFDVESLLPQSPLTASYKVDDETKVSETIPHYCCNTACSICLEDFTKDERLRLLPCGHLYHTSCISPWLTKRTASCPLCKRCLYSKDNKRQ